MRFILCLLLSIAVFSAIASPAFSYPPDFTDMPYVSSLPYPVAQAWTPDGRLFVALIQGTVRVVQGGTLLPEPAISLNVENFEEQGLLGITFHTAFPDSPYVYLLYTPNLGTPTNGHHRISRFNVTGNTFVAASEAILFTGLPTGNGFHVGGCLRMSPDQKLFAVVGDNGHGTGVQNAQSLTRLEGKMIRLTSTGKIPSDNPFVGTAGARGEIWHRGFRNPFRFALQPSTGLPFVCDVGGQLWEEIDVAPAGANFGWPNAEGPETPPDSGVTNPKYAYETFGNACITGAAFHPGPGFPGGYTGNFFFLDHSRGHLSRMVLDAGNNVVSVDRTWGLTSAAGWLSGPVDLSVGPDGALYYTTYDPGQVRRVGYTGTAGVDDDRGLLRISLAANVPNPLSNLTHITFGLPARADVNLVVCDLSGRRIRTLVDGPRGPGNETVSWEGRDDQGRAVPPGMYLARLTSLGDIAVRRMVVVR